MAASSRRRKVRTDVDTDRSVQNQMIVMYQTRARARADSAGASEVNTVAMRPPTEKVRSPMRNPGDDRRAATGARFRRVPVSSRRTMKPLEREEEQVGGCPPGDAHAGHADRRHARHGEPLRRSLARHSPGQGWRVGARAWSAEVARRCHRERRGGGGHAGPRVCLTGPQVSEWELRSPGPASAPDVTAGAGSGASGRGGCRGGRGARRGPRCGRERTARPRTRSPPPGCWEGR